MHFKRENYAVGYCYGNIDVVNRGTDLEYRKGTYTFYQGVVTIYAEPKFCTFGFVHKGRHYHMTISELKQPLTDRALIIRAGKFGREVVKNDYKK